MQNLLFNFSGMLFSYSCSEAPQESSMASEVELIMTIPALSTNLANVSNLTQFQALPFSQQRNPILNMLKGLRCLNQD